MWRFIKDFFIYGFASVLGKIAAIFLMPIYTNILTKEEYGAMALITACKGIIDLISNLNIHSGIARDYYEPDINRKKLVSTGIWSILGISCTVLVVLLLTRGFWLTSVLGLETIYMLPFVVMLVSIPAGSSLSYFAIMTRFERKSVKYSIGTILQLIVQIGISIYGVVVLRTGIVSIFIGVLLGELVGIVYFGYINRANIGFTFEYKYLKRALKFSLPTLPAILAGWIDSSMGQILIGKYISQTQLGIYSVALQFASVFTLVSIALNNVWGPYLYENYKREGFLSEVKKLYTFILVALIAISVNLSLLSEELVVLLSNETYADASKYLTLLCIPMSIYLLFPIANSGISISRDTKYTGIAYVAGSIINLIAMFVLLPYLGVIAVPMSLALSRITTYTFLYQVSKSKKIIVLPNQMLYVLVVSVVLCFVVLKQDFSLPIRCLLLFVVDTMILYYMYRKVNVFFLIKKK